MKARPYSMLVPAWAALVLLFLVVPTVVIIYSALSPSSRIAFPPQAITLKWFGNFFGHPQFRDALVNTLLVTALVTPVSLAIAVPTALAMVRRRFPGRGLLSALALSPLAVPGVVIGVAFLNFFSWTGLYTGFWKISLALVVITLPFAIRAIVATLEGADLALEEAARNLGAGRFRTFLTITLPQLRPGMLAGGIFVFVEAIDNFSTVVFLTDMQTNVLSVQAYSYIRDFNDPTVSAMATILILQSVVLVVLLQRFAGFDKIFAGR
ncbi:ABC transporter permease [Oceanicella sp. SM1341]|uniref:ABC transporter permease n=1 Tax=Oceanicella sp. SM1341 TaxID=1548889 RepID=UPI000E519282|nr:ABC transporter permease [Oceanicella sp. SM1341]